MKQQKRLQSLLDTSGITQKKAAEFIAAHTKRPCSVRAVRSWLADESLPSARPCPKWAVEALEARLKKLKKT